MIADEKRTAFIARRVCDEDNDRSLFNSIDHCGRSLLVRTSFSSKFSCFEEISRRGEEQKREGKRRIGLIVWRMDDRCGLSGLTLVCLR